MLLKSLPLKREVKQSKNIIMPGIMNYTDYKWNKLAIS